MAKEKAETVKIQTLATVGNPTAKDSAGLAVKIARGAVVEIAQFWASRLIAQGLAKLAGDDDKKK